MDTCVGSVRHHIYTMADNPIRYPCGNISDEDVLSRVEQFLKQSAEQLCELSDDFELYYNGKGEKGKETVNGTLRYLKHKIVKKKESDPLHSKAVARTAEKMRERDAAAAPSNTRVTICRKFASICSATGRRVCKSHIRVIRAHLVLVEIARFVAITAVRGVLRGLRRCESGCADGHQ